MSHEEPALPSTSDAWTYRLTLAYDGRAYHGWQRHAGKPTVQGAVEAAIASVFGVPCTLHGSGRTDRGVHADAQVAHFVAPVALPAAQILEDLNGQLASDVRISACEAIHAGFHARDDAVAKTYRFEIWNAPDCPPEVVGRVWHIPGALDVNAMAAACAVLVGSRDFSSFATKVNFAPRSMVRNLMSVDLERDAARIIIRFRADGFLYKMVRNLVRAVVKVGEGRSSLTQLADIIEARDRNAAPGTAPASGLYLERVQYDPA